MSVWLWRVRGLSLATLSLAALLVTASCSSGAPDTAEDGSPRPSVEVPTSTPTADDEPTGGVELAALPVCEGPRRETTNGVPHVQIDAELVPGVDAELR